MDARTYLNCIKVAIDDGDVRSLIRYAASGGTPVRQGMVRAYGDREIPLCVMQELISPDDDDAAAAMMYAKFVPPALQAARKGDRAGFWTLGALASHHFRFVIGGRYRDTSRLLLAEPGLVRICLAGGHEGDQVLFQICRERPELEKAVNDIRRVLGVLSARSGPAGKFVRRDGDHACLVRVVAYL